MKTKTYYVTDRNGREHEIILENDVNRYYVAFKDGVKEYFIKECLSFDAAFRTYCAEYGMRPVSSKTFSSSTGISTGSGDTGTPGVPSDKSGACCLAMLEILSVLFKKEIISRSELDSLKTKIMSLFSAKF